MSDNSGLVKMGYVVEFELELKWGVAKLRKVGNKEQSNTSEGEADYKHDHCAVQE